jgi:hypothetical protein
MNSITHNTMDYYYWLFRELGPTNVPALDVTTTEALLNRVLDRDMYGFHARHMARHMLLGIPLDMHYVDYFDHDDIIPDLVSDSDIDDDGPPGFLDDPIFPEQCVVGG